jgi:hypothetical protein
MTTEAGIMTTAAMMTAEAEAVGIRLRQKGPTRLSP